MTYLLTKDIHTNAQYALTCVTSAIEDRVAARSDEIKNSMISGVKDYMGEVVGDIKD